MTWFCPFGDCDKDNNKSGNFRITFPVVLVGKPGKLYSAVRFNHDVDKIWEIIWLCKTKSSKEGDEEEEENKQDKIREVTFVGNSRLYDQSERVMKRA